jgi:L,D-peptidoglycan transpeptidase YkuD (ErfK/YbiS/YcfS/YnhG family)
MAGIVSNPAKTAYQSEKEPAMSRHDLFISPSGARFLNRRFACTIGRSGFTEDKREGDGATPLGIHKIVGMLYRPDRIAAAALPDWALPIRLGDLWSDDSNDPDYNTMVAAPHPYRHEKLRRADPLYDLILITDWNWPYATAGQGSAIFLHRWRGPCYPTAGCVAFAPENLLWIAGRLRPQSRLVIQG